MGIMNFVAVVIYAVAIYTMAISITLVLFGLPFVAVSGTIKRARANPEHHFANSMRYLTVVVLVSAYVIGMLRAIQMALTTSHFENVVEGVSRILTSL